MIKTLKELGKYSKQYRMFFLLGSILTILLVLKALVDPFVSGKIIDSIYEGNFKSYITIGVGLLIGTTLIRGVLKYSYFMIFEKISQKIVYNLRQDLYKKIQSLDFSYFDKTSTGNIMSKMTGDIEAIRHFYAFIVQMSIFHSFLFIFGLISMIIINPLLASLLLITVPFIAFFSINLAKSVKPKFVNIREQFSRLNTVVQENISGNRVVKAFAMEPYEIQKFQIENEGFKKCNLEAANIWEKYLPELDAFSILFNVIVLLIGGLLIINNKMSIGELVAFNRLLWMVNNPLRMIGWLINSSQNFVASYEKIKELLDEESAIPAVEQTVKKDRINGYISFKDVSFHYENVPVLQRVSFDVKPGQTIALLGSTGSGKSTLINLISRFYDADEGEILIDHQNIQKYDLNNLRSNISIAMQDIFLFSDTIQGNISYGVPNASGEEVRWASKISGVKEFIYKFDQGFNTIVGERGVGLSGGQKQRIALARALIQNPSILILDDTTSAVDMETEYKILSELKKVNENRTTFIIAQRISSVKDADIILVMDEGCIIERGTHEQLIKQQGYYYDVFMQQMGEFNSLEKEGA